MELYRIIIGLLFLVVGFVLFRAAMVARLRLEKEVKEGRTINLHNMLPYRNGDDFTETGNVIRKQYNRLYYVLIIYSMALFLFMKSGD